MVMKIPKLQLHLTIPDCETEKNHNAVPFCIRKMRDYDIPITCMLEHVACVSVIRLMDKTKKTNRLRRKLTDDTALIRKRNRSPRKGYKYLIHPTKDVVSTLQS
jgi:hypothetical protein